jgi:hypothetical protein
VEAGIPLGKSQKYSVSLRPDLTTSVRLSFEARFLTIIPASKPNVKLGLDSAKYPFLSAILKQPNRLKACIVTGNEKVFGLYLFENYRPCSNGMWHVIQLVETTRLIFKCPCVCLFVHPYPRMSDKSSSDPMNDNGDIESLLVEAARHIPLVTLFATSAVRRIAVVLPINGVPKYYFKGLVSEMLALVRPAAQDYMCCKSLEEGGLSAWDIQLDFFGATYSEAINAGEAVSTFAHSHPFARSQR